jgi:hypothetical protein
MGTPTNEAGKEKLCGFLLVVAVFLAYVPVWWAGFIWDDDFVITANPVIVGPLGLKEIWTTSASDICPLTLTTFWVEYQLWGASPLPFHLVTPPARLSSGVSCFNCAFLVSGLAHFFGRFTQSRWSPWRGPVN